MERWMLSVGLVMVLLAGCGNKQQEAPVQPPTTNSRAEDKRAPTTGRREESTKAASAAPLESERLKGETVRYQAGDTTMVGYLAYDSNITGQRPGVLVVHEWWGHNDYARSRADMLAKMGYTALAIDMYGDGKQAEHPEDAQKFSQAVANDPEAGMARFNAAKELLESHPTTDPDKTAAIGYCFGGGVVLNMARVGSDLDLVASFHGSLAPLATAEEGGIKAKVLVFHGEADPFVSAEAVEAFKQEMEEAKAALEFVSYPGVKHAFTNPGATELGERFELPLEYNREADQASWAAFSEQLAAVFSP